MNFLNNLRSSFSTYRVRPIFDMFESSSIFLGMRRKSRKLAPTGNKGKSARYRAMLKAKYNRLENQRNS